MVSKQSAVYTCSDFQRNGSDMKLYMEWLLIVFIQFYQKYVK